MAIKRKIKKLTKIENELIEFFVINCPVQCKENGKMVSVSQKGLYFKNLNYTKYEITCLLKAIKHDINDNLEWCDKNNIEIAEEMIKKNNNYMDNQFEYIALIEDSQKKKTKTIFYMIRNALAHGDYDIKEDFITLKCQNKGKIKSYMRLRVETLLKIKKRFLDKNFEEVLSNGNL